MRLARVIGAVLVTAALTVGSAVIMVAQTPAAQTPAAQTPAGAVRHVVIFKYKPTATPAQIAEVTAAFRGLQKTIPGIVAFEAGVNDSPEKKNLGFTHVYMLTFESPAARDTYLPHPKHKEFGQLLGKLAVVEDVFVVDYAPSK